MKPQQPSKKWARRRSQGHTFLFKYEDDAPELLHIFVRHMTTPKDAIQAFFEGSTTWNEQRQRFETESETHMVYWLWLDEATKKVLVISCFNV